MHDVIVVGAGHTGAGAFPMAFPMAFLSGWPGRNGAREVIRDQDAGPVDRLIDRILNRHRPTAPVTASDTPALVPMTSGRVAAICSDTPPAGNRVTVAVEPV